MKLDGKAVIGVMFGVLTGVAAQYAFALLKQRKLLPGVI